MWTYLHIEIRPELQEFPSLYLDCRSISSCSLPCGHCTAAAGCLYTWPCCTWSLCTGTPRGRGTRTSICSLFWRFPSPSNASLWEEPSFFNNRAPERSPWPRTLSASLRTAWRCSARPWLGRQLREMSWQRQEMSSPCCCGPSAENNVRSLSTDSQHTGEGSAGWREKSFYLVGIFDDWHSCIFLSIVAANKNNFMVKIGVL